MKKYIPASEKSVNKFWGAYGTDKIAAEKALLESVKDLCKLMEVIINEKPEEHILNLLMKTYWKARYFCNENYIFTSNQ